MQQILTGNKCKYFFFYVVIHWKFWEMYTDKASVITDDYVHFSIYNYLNLFIIKNCSEIVSLSLYCSVMYKAIYSQRGPEIGKTGSSNSS